MSVTESTREQDAALERLSIGQGGEQAVVEMGPFDLPPGYMLVHFPKSGFTCGISPDGDVSS